MNKNGTETAPCKNRDDRQIEKQEREELLKMCYSRLREMIPACNSETTLIKCIEMLEKQGADKDEENTKEKRLHAIAATLDRLSELNGD